MLHAHRFSRANTIPEMALVISLVMVTLFGVIEYALTGFDQIGADGAAFVGDHSTVAEYAGNPTINQGNVYGQLVGQSNFPQSSGYNASVPKSNTFELDLSSSQRSLGTATLFPSTVATRSRIIEPAQTSTSAVPQGQCASFAEYITYKGTTILNRKVRLLSALPGTTGVGAALYSTVQDTKGHSALSFAGGTLSSDTELTALHTISTDFSTAASNLASISTVLNAVGATSTASGISAQISPLLLSAAGGTYGASGGTTITVTTPLTSTQFAAQVSASTNAISGIQNSNLLNTVLNTVLKGVINPLLYGGTITQSIGGLVSGTVVTSGLLSGGPNGGILNDMNNAQNTLYTLDSTLPSC
jgi:hypothetical protein